MIERPFTVAFLALAYAGIAVGAQAFEETREERRVIVHEGGPAFDHGRVDANDDGWVTRAEAQAEAERMFGEMDSNHDGKLDAADHDERDVVMFNRHVGHGEGTPAPEVRTDRRVVVIHRERADSDAPPPPHAAHPPLAPMPPRPPMFVMMLANAEEADRNGDGALSRDEFVRQQLRFFDAGDGNGDGRIRFEMPDPPEPPEAPEPPMPPAPPR